MLNEVVYAGITRRLIAILVDLFVVSVISSFIVILVNKMSFLWYFYDFFASKNVNPFHLDDKSLLNMILSEEFGYNYQKETQKFFLWLLVINLVTQFMICAFYFIGCWSLIGNTAGKALMRIKVVDADNFQKPLLAQSIKRFFGYFLFALSLVYIIFSKKNISYHDKIAGTAVIRV